MDLSTTHSSRDWWSWRWRATRTSPAIGSRWLSNKKAGGVRRPLLLLKTSRMTRLAPAGRLLRGLLLGACALAAARLASGRLLRRGLLARLLLCHSHCDLSRTGVCLPTDPPVDRRRCGRARGPPHVYTASE